MINEGADSLGFNPSIPILPNGTEGGLDITVSLILSDGSEIVIYGGCLQNLTDGWIEEVEIYVDNSYDTGGSLYIADASVFYMGNVTVLRDDYFEYDLPTLLQKDSKEDG